MTTDAPGVGSELKLATGPSWAAIAGRWWFEGAVARYLGPGEKHPLPYGLALSSLRLRDGELQAKISFSSLRDASAGFVVGYRSESTPYVVPQLGGYARAYAIASFEPGLGWRAVASAGSIENLKPEPPYTLKTSIRGQRLRLAVDEVSILDHVLPQPISGDQVGLYAWGDSQVRFEEVAVLGKQGPRVFVAMPFHEPFETFYREVICPVAQEKQLTVVRIDEKAGPGIIFEDMKREIEEATVVIAEISALNPNGFYEIGYSHALIKPTILLAQRGKELPFDIRSYRVIFYEDSIGGKPAVERKLRQHLDAILMNL